MLCHTVSYHDQSASVTALLACLLYNLGPSCNADEAVGVADENISTKKKTILKSFIVICIIKPKLVFILDESYIFSFLHA